MKQQFHIFNLRALYKIFKKQGAIPEYPKQDMCMVTIFVWTIAELIFGNEAFLILTTLLPLVLAATYFRITILLFQTKMELLDKQFVIFLGVNCLMLLLNPFIDDNWATGMRGIIFRGLFIFMCVMIARLGQRKLNLVTLRKFYHFRDYVVPVTGKGKVAGVLFLILTLLGSVSTFYRNIYSMRIVNSLNLAGIRNSTANESAFTLQNVGAVWNEFRWDLIVVYYVVRYLDHHVLWLLKYYLQEAIRKDSCSRLQMAIFTKLQHLSLRWHLENQASEIFSMMSSSSIIIQDIIDTASWVIPEGVNMVVTVTYMFQSYHFKLFSAVILTGLTCAFIDYHVIRQREKRMEDLDKGQVLLRKTRSIIFENYETMKLFTNEEYERSKYTKAYFEDKVNELKEFTSEQLYHLLRNFIRTVSEAIVVLIVVRAVLDGNEGLTPGDYLYFSTVFATILWPLDSFIKFYRKLQKYSIDVGKILSVLHLTPEICDEPNARELMVEGTSGSIEFRNVSFSYDPAREIIKNFSAVIPAGTRVAIVGTSGSGKSTLAKLLFRFYDPTGGEILINGQNIRNIKCSSLRKSIGVVPQDVVLFPDTISMNIRYGNLMATDEEVVKAATAASLHKRILEFPEEYNSVVGNRGLKLSGGERQRIAIARTILKNAPITILDEATSSLDSETEKNIQGTLEGLFKGRTSIIIAHRLSTTVNVNKIFVLEGGTLVESGTHNELLSRDGAYASLWNRQFGNNF